MMTRLSEIRHELAELLVSGLGDGVAVSPSPPTAITAPGVIVRMDGGKRSTSCRYTLQFVLVLIGPGGDNEAGVQALETLIDDVQNVLGQAGLPAGEWGAPYQTSTTPPYLAVDLALTTSAT